MSMLSTILEWFDEEEFLIADGFDEAIIGIDESSYRIIYSFKKCIQILMDEGMLHEDSIEHFEYNVRGSYVGEKTPIWCVDHI